MNDDNDRGETKDLNIHVGEMRLISSLLRINMGFANRGINNPIIK
jgi:hypothetical protein